MSLNRCTTRLNSSHKQNKRVNGQLGIWIKAIDVAGLEIRGDEVPLNAGRSVKKISKHAFN